MLDVSRLNHKVINRDKDNHYFYYNPILYKYFQHLPTNIFKEI